MSNGDIALVKKMYSCDASQGMEYLDQQHHHVSSQLFLSDPGVPGVRFMGPVLCHYVQDVVADLTDVTLVDEDTVNANL